jgi:transposase
MSQGIGPRYRLRVKQRQIVVEYAIEHGKKPAGHHFGLDRKTVRDWVNRYQAAGLVGLVPQYPKHRPRRIAESTVALIREAREQHRWGAQRTRIWLQRVHNLHVNARSIQHIFRDLGMPRLTKTPRRKPKQLRLFEKDDPGESVQIDVKVVRLRHEKVFQYTALDDCTRLRVLRLFPRQNQWASLQFLTDVREAMPFPIRKIQCDNGAEFPLAFRLAVEHAGIRHRYIRPRRPEQNGKVERSHRIDAEEFWSRHRFDRLADAEEPLRHWERHYNQERFSLALGGRTPAEKLAAHLHRSTFDSTATGSTTERAAVTASEHAPAQAKGRAERAAKVPLNFGARS